MSFYVYRSMFINTTNLNIIRGILSSMEFAKRNIRLKIRRFDLSDEPETIEKTWPLYPNLDYKAITAELFKLCEASAEKHVLKIRNKDNCLIPISFLVENEEPFYFIDVATISCFGTNANSLLQDAYVDSVCNKVKFLESRIAQAELLLPQMEWRRQSYMEDTISALLNKVQFLNRRFDELYPKYKSGKLVSDFSP